MYHLSTYKIFALSAIIFPRFLLVENNLGGMPRLDPGEASFYINQGPGPVLSSQDHSATMRSLVFILLIGAACECELQFRQIL